MKNIITKKFSYINNFKIADNTEFLCDDLIDKLNYESDSESCIGNKKIIDDKIVDIILDYIHKNYPEYSETYFNLKLEDVIKNLSEEKKKDLILDNILNFKFETPLQPICYQHAEDKEESLEHYCNNSPILKEIIVQLKPFNTMDIIGDSYKSYRFVIYDEYLNKSEIGSNYDIRYIDSLNLYYMIKLLLT